MQQNEIEGANSAFFSGQKFFREVDGSRYLEEFQSGTIPKEFQIHLLFPIGILGEF